MLGSAGRLRARSEGEGFTSSSELVNPVNGSKQLSLPALLLTASGRCTGNARKVTVARQLRTHIVRSNQFGLVPPQPIWLVCIRSNQYMVQESNFLLMLLEQQNRTQKLEKTPLERLW